jgi:hypothetical protein
MVGTLEKKMDNTADDEQYTELPAEEEVNYGAWIPCSWALMQHKLPEADWRWLENHGLLYVSEYSFKEGRSREFKLPIQVVRRFVEIGEEVNYIEYVDAEMVNLFTGNIIKSKPTTEYHDPKNRNRHPQRYCWSVREVHNHWRPFNFTEIEKVIAKRKADMDWAKEVHGEGSDEFITAEGRYRNDDLCFRAVLRSEFLKKVNEYIWMYKPAYRMALSGRAIEIKGGLQSCSRLMKAASVKGLNHIRNYDLVSSQVIFLIQLCQMANLSTEWLEAYRDDRNPDGRKSKEYFAEQADLSIDCWKSCLLTIIMGGYCPTQVKPPKPKKPGQKRNYDNSILEYIYKDANKDLELTAEKLRRFKETIKPLKDVIDKLHDFLLDTWIPKEAYRSSRNGKKYITNKCGAKLCLSGPDFPKAPHKRKSKVTAFLLQGLECSFTHYLTCLGPAYGFKVLANEFDGLLVEGEIPEEAIRLAGKHVGLPNPRFEIKSFCDQREIEDFYIANSCAIESAPSRIEGMAESMAA